MPVDVSTDIVIDRPRAEVAAFAAEPTNAPQWYENIQEATWVGPPGLAVGARCHFVATFLGRRMVYTYEIRAWAPGERLVMHVADGPFPMQTTYTFEDAGDGATRMTLRNQGQPTGFSRWAKGLIVPAMRKANDKDLAALKRLLERA